MLLSDRALLSPPLATVRERRNQSRLLLPVVAGEPVGLSPLRWPLRRRCEGGETSVPHGGRVHRVDLGLLVASCGGRRRRVGCVCTSSASHSGEGLWVGSGELVAVDSCHLVWVVRLGFARPACAAAGCSFRAVDGEAVAASAAVDFVPGLFLRVVWRCFVAGVEFFGCVYRSLPGSGFAGGCELDAGSVEEGGSGGCSPLDGAAAHLREVRGSSPTDALQPASSRRPRARRVSLEVLQNMVLARSWVRWRFVFFVFVYCWCSGGGDGLDRRAVSSLLLLASLFLCLFSVSGQSVCELVCVSVLRFLL